MYEKLKSCPEKKMFMDNLHEIKGKISKIEFSKL